MFEVKAGILYSANMILPTRETLADRVLIRLPSRRGGQGSLFGPRNAESIFLDQHIWIDGSPLLHTSTSQLRLMQTSHCRSRHSALTKWELQLNCNIPVDIWASTWCSYRSAGENTFMWQLVYRIIATQKWRFPTRIDSDESTWCTRCSAGVREDVMHCIWSCRISRQCWQWCKFMLRAVAHGNRTPINLDPAHIFIAVPIPEEWHIPLRFWHLMRVIICWQIWKDRNVHFFEGKRSVCETVIHKSWHRLGLYLRLEWKSLYNRVRQGKITFGDAETAMRNQFGSNPAIWNLHEHILQVPPVPPRPPWVNSVSRS